MLLVVGAEGGQATHVVCWPATQITGSPPLLSDLDILREMENEGPGNSIIFCPIASSLTWWVSLPWLFYIWSLSRWGKPLAQDGHTTRACTYIGAGSACPPCHSLGTLFNFQCDTQTHTHTHSSCVRAYVTQCALVVAVILRCSTSWQVFRSIRQSTSFQSYCSYLLSELALGPTVILRVYSCLDLGPETGGLQRV